MKRTFREFLENLTEDQKTRIIDEAIKMQEQTMSFSERKELLNKLNEAVKEQSRIKYSVLSFVTGVVNMSDYLTTEQKTKLLESFWRGE